MRTQKKDGMGQGGRDVDANKAGGVFIAGPVDGSGGRSGDARGNRKRIINGETVEALVESETNRTTADGRTARGSSIIHRLLAFPGVPASVPAFEGPAAAVPRRPPLPEPIPIPIGSAISATTPVAT